MMKRIVLFSALFMLIFFIGACSFGPAQNTNVKDDNNDGKYKITFYDDIFMSNPNIIVKNKGIN